MNLLKKILYILFLVFLFPQFGKNTLINKSSITSNFVASLELAKNGFVEVKQTETFGNIFIRSKSL